MVSSFSSYFHRSEEESVRDFLQGLRWGPKTIGAVQERAVDLVKAVRSQKRKAGQLESFLQDYALDTEEGLALMTLAEALLRVPDKQTSKALIRDKVAAANWLDSVGSSQDWVVKAAGVGLFMTSKTLDGVLSRLGEPIIREAMLRAMRILGQQFVLGVDIEDAMQNAQALERQRYRMSYDILGEGARTAADAQRYFENYAHAIDYIGQRAKGQEGRRPGLSVKLSALHPRYEFSQADRCVPEMAARLIDLARKAARYDIALTVDAEETQRLDLSLAIFEKVLSSGVDAEWEGLGLAVQAYHKAAPAVIDHISGLAQTHKRRLQMRLVKGAYWDTEIKQAQVEGLEEFPVYTRKSHTDASYIACAAKMFGHARWIYPMLGTHNAHSVAAVLELAQSKKADFEFQRLFGMGQGLYDAVLEDEDIGVSVYAPVGPHSDLLPYLVRRLLENGANSSFVNRILDPDASVEELVADPVDKSKKQTQYNHPKISKPSGLFIGETPHGRRNSAGLDLHASGVADQLLSEMGGYSARYDAAVLVGGQIRMHGSADVILNPAKREDVVGEVYNGRYEDVTAAFEVAREGFPEWAGMDAAVRAQMLKSAADTLEERRSEFMALLVREAGKTIPDALSEVREAVDFLRYYANQGQALFAVDGTDLPGPTGERNRLTMHGRGTFVCISPWNFPLAIFTGQIAAALMAGNCVIAKPAEQTPLIGMLMVELLHEEGVPEQALQLIPGDGQVGAMLASHQDVDGVVFTGSTAVAQEINKTLAAKDGPIVPLIAETGGQNAMIVDSSALPEQVIDDVLLSAFGSAGQRCSALRVLCVQDDVADKIIRMLKGAMAELQVGNPAKLSSDIGPVIDDDAYAMLAHHHESMTGCADLIYEVEIEAGLKRKGHYFAPCAFEIPDMSVLSTEVFGPVLHVIRYRRDELDELLADLAGTGYGLTFGVHSRIESFHEAVIAQMPVGNVYVNRSMIGAIVGSQPFGGQGLSGTGPKAGGPHYLARFATERVVSIDTTAAGGNASLVSLSE